MRPDGPRYSNCLLWALGQLARRGGYIAVRRGRNRSPVHFLWSPDLARWYSYRPLKGKRWPLWDLLVFRGKVTEGDPELRNPPPVAR